MAADDTRSLLVALLPRIRSAYAETNTAMWCISFEAVGDMPISAPQGFLPTEHSVHTIYTIGGVQLGNVAEKRHRFFNLCYRGKDEKAIEQFQRISADAGAAILSDAMLKRMSICAFDGPASLWMQFLYHFGSPRKEGDVDILGQPYGQAIVAIERAFHPQSAAQENGGRSPARHRLGSDHRSLSELQRLVLEIIKGQPHDRTISGASIVKILQQQHKRITSLPTVTSHIIPALRPLGVKSRRKGGYWFDRSPTE